MTQLEASEATSRRPVLHITPEVKAHAPQVFGELRALGPVHRVQLGSGIDVWGVFSYEEARAALTHPALLHDVTPAEALLAGAGITSHKVGVGLGGSMLQLDPPDHTRLRRLVAPAFSPRRTQSLARRVQEITDGLLDAMAGRREVDLVESFTAPLPITVICELLGVPEGERDDFRRWTSDFLSPPSEQQRAGGLSLNRYVSGLVDRKRAEPADDLLSDLTAQSSTQDGRLSQDELVATASLLVIAGHDTTVNLMGNALVALFRHPDQAQLLRERPELVEPAVEEFLRLDSSVEVATMRYAAQDLELGGAQIRRGDVVAVYLAQASRDAPQGEGDPATLDVTRPSPRHLSFGHGIHHCLGAPLARMEASTAIGALLRRFPNLRPAVPLDEVRWIPAGMMRGPLSLPVLLMPE